MAQYNSRAYQSRGVYKSNYNQGFDRNNGFSYGGNRPQKEVKHSGARSAISSKGKKKPFITAWKYTKRTGLFNIVACPNDKEESKNPKYKLWTAKVTMKMFPSQIVSALYNVEKKILILPDMNLTIDPQRGYVAYFKPRRR